MRPSATELSINLSAIIYQENGVWIAHCLELDIVVEGADPDDAIDGLISLCDLQINVALSEGDLGSIFKPAPPEIWQMFSMGRQKVLTGRKAARRRPRFQSPVERFEARQLAFA